MTAPCSFIEEESGVILSPMTFKTFVWPHNPRVYAITYERKMAVYKIPFGRHFLQRLGQTGGCSRVRGNRGRGGL